jgi:hypothetical protein
MTSSAAAISCQRPQNRARFASLSPEVKGPLTRKIIFLLCDQFSEN